MSITIRIISILFSLVVISCNEKKVIVFQSDFGLKDGAVSAMKGVAIEVDPDLKLFDLTHEIPSYNIWEAAYRLNQAAVFWPEGTVFVSVVDPGVGTERESVVLKTQSGHFFVSPDNGTLTMIAESLGIEEVRRIDEAINRRKNSNASYTFHGRDVYAYTAARLASGVISFDEVGPLLPKKVVMLDYKKPVLQGDSIVGNIPILDIQYGNVWTNIPDSLYRKLGTGTSRTLVVRIFLNDSIVYSGEMPYANTFGAVPEKHPLAYSNSLLNLAFALNMGSFADSFHVGSGPEWSVIVKKNILGK